MALTWARRILPGQGVRISTASGQRLHFFDGLRASAMLLGVFYHAAGPLAASTPIAEAASWASNGFRMSLFFVIAGFFGHLLVERNGAVAFLRQRLLRIGVPLAVGIGVFLPLVHGSWNLAGVALPGPALDPRLGAILAGELGIFEFLGASRLQHLWFLQYLLILYTVAVLGRSGWRWLGRDSGRGHASHALGRLLASRWRVPLLALPTATLLAWSGGLGLVGEGHHLLPPLVFLAYYGLFFGAGWLLYGARNGVADFSRCGWSHIAGAAAILLLVAPAWAWSPIHSDHAALRAIAFLATGAFSWLMIFGLAGLFRKYLNRASATTRYVADASYWIYLVHLPVVTIARGALASAGSSASGLGVGLEFLLVCGITFGVGFVSYQTLVRYSPIGVVLNGRRVRSEGRSWLHRFGVSASGATPATNADFR